MRVAVIGAGPGGYVAALKAAQLGAEVTVVEDTEVGGTCLNRGCIPTKAILASATAYARAREIGSFGIELSGSLTPNLRRIMERKDKIVGVQVKGIRALFKSWGVGLIEGRGRLKDAGMVEVSGRDGSLRTIAADRVIVATGSRPASIPAFPFDGERILSSDDALALTEIPRSIIIVGAGVIGCEWACIFGDLGAEVTIIEMLPRCIATEDTEVSALLAREFKKRKIRLLTGVGAERVSVEDGGVRALLTDGAELKAERMLVSIGRAFNTNDIGLEDVGVRLGARGAIAVNDRCETSVPGVYAVGDATGGLLLAHTASHAGVVAAANACGADARTDFSSVPAAIFTSPEIASVGLRDFQSEERGIAVRTGEFQFRALGKAHAMGEISGFVKIIADSATDRVLGAHIIGPHASDLVHEAALAIRAGLTSRDIARTIHAHPTLSEGLMEAAEDVHGASVHALKR